MEGTNGLKESEESLVVGLGRVVREKAVCGIIRQWSVSLSKIIILVEDHSGTALVCREDKDVGIGPEGAKSLALRWGYTSVLSFPRGLIVIKNN